MDIARLQRPAKLEKVTVADVVAAACEDVPPPDHLAVHTEVAPDAVVTATSSGLERLLTNLLGNAYRHASTRVRVRGEVVDDHVVVVVEDDGDGVPEAFVPDLFRDFARGPNAEPGTGTGLGLAIVQRLVTTFGGSVEYSVSDDLGGAAFLLTLPTSGA